MQIVIEIPDDEYELIVGSEDCGLHMLTRAVAHGTPLPKGHGDLVDRDNIEVLRLGNLTRIYDKGFDAGVTCMVNRILEAATIIEADTEVKADDE